MTDLYHDLTEMQKERLCWNTIFNLCGDISPSAGAVAILHPLGIDYAHGVYCGAVIAAAEAGQPLVG